jgi:hypothetical protein
MKILKALLLIVSAVAVVGCSGGPQLETRVFEVKYLEMHRVHQLVEPYVFYNRKDAPGTFSMSGQLLTVRETADNLTRIELVLAQFDQKRPEIMLHVDVIEANGGEVDPAIADIQVELAELFKFTGYTRVAGGVLTAIEGRLVTQSMGIGNSAYRFEAQCGHLTEDEGEWLLFTDLQLSRYGRDLLSTSAMIRDGQTTLVGTSLEGDVKAVILAIRPEIRE